MAVPAAARRSESLYANLDAGPNTPASPRRSSHHSPARTPTPRPSISPLSVASKAARGSPIATRDAIMRDSELEEEAAEAHHAADAEAEIGDVPDDRSSSLSEPEDLDEDEDTLAFVANGAKSTLPLPAQKTLDVDSEAETERLDDSPQKRRQHADSVGRTPSKLSKAAGVEDELSEPPSPLPTGPGAASRQKRKRSDAEDSPLTSEESDVEQSPRKRSHALDANPLEGEIAQTTETNGIEEVQENEEVEIEQQIIEAPAAIPAKGIKGKRGRKPGRKPKSQEEAQELDVSEFAVDNEEEEPSAEIAPKSEEELKQKGEASSSFEQLAKQFAAFRQRLVNESLASAEHELALLNQADCVHPEYLRQVSCIDERKAKQEREANAYYRYRIQAVRERTLGERAQLHSQYFQTARELRENMLYALGEDWYGIQKERRQQHQEGEERYLYKLPSKKSAQIRQQAKYNQEVSVLSGIAKYVGFPAAPNISGVEGHGLEDDFKAMRIPRRMHQPVQHVHAHQQQHTHPSQQQQQHHQIQQQQAQIQQQQQQHQQAVYTQPPNVPPAAPSERQAHEQFLEQNAWARPQPSTVTAHVTPNFTHTPDWVDQPANPRHIMRNLTGPGQRTGSPFATPVSGKRAAGFMGDGPDVASSGLAAPPTISRTPGQGFSTGSPLQVGKQRQQNGNTGHNGERELTGFRNISNISSTSTIDAPLSAEKAQQEADRTPHYEGSLLARYLPALHSEGSAPHQAFDTSQLHRHPNAEEGGPGKDVYANPSFRPTEGAYGTPQASLMSGRTVPPGGQM